MKNNKLNDIENLLSFYPTFEYFIKIVKNNINYIFSYLSYIYFIYLLLYISFYLFIYLLKHNCF